MPLQQEDLVTVSIVFGILGAIGTGMFKLFRKSTKIDLNEKAIKEIKGDHEEDIKQLRKLHEKSIGQLREVVDKDSRELRESLELVKNSDIKNIHTKINSLESALNDVQRNLSTIMNNNHKEILKMFIELSPKDGK